MTTPNTPAPVAPAPLDGVAADGAAADGAAVDAERERARWTAAAGHWDRWADPMAELADKLNQPLLDAAAVGPGHRVLDLASGAGEPALSAARRVGAGPGGLVVGTDLVPAMLAGSVRRAAAGGAERCLPLHVLAADMVRLPFADASFDAVTCRFGVMFVPDAVAALAEARRVLAPGGRVAVMVWGPRADNALFDLVGTVVEDRLGPDPVHRLDTLFRFAAPGSLAAALDAAGFADTGERALTPVRKVPRGQPVWRATLGMVFGPRLAHLAEAERAAIDDAIARRMDACTDGDRVPLPAHVRIGIGRA